MPEHPDITTLRQCTRCHELKPLTGFGPERRKKDGLSSWCKVCDASAARTWRLAHPEESIETKRAYREAHREELRAKANAYYETHLEGRHVYNAAIYAAHRVEQLASAHVYYRLHRTERIAASGAWRKSHPEKRRAYGCTYRARHPHEIAERTRRRQARIRGAMISPIDLEAIKVRDRMRCCICGKKVAERDFSLDHIVPLSLGGAHSQENLRVAHRRCNSRRGAGRLPVQMVLV